MKLTQYTRTEGGADSDPLPHQFFANNSKTLTRSTTKFWIPTHKLRINLACNFWHLRSKDQFTKSGQSQMCIPVPALKLKIVLWAQFSSNVFRLSGCFTYWSGCLQNVFGFVILANSGQVNFRPGALQPYSGWGSLPPITFNQRW